MARKLTDFAQLSKALFRSQTTEQPPAAPPAPPTAEAALSRDEAEVLAYFSKGNDTNPKRTVPRKTPAPKAEDRSAELEGLKVRIAELESLLQQSECDQAQAKAKAESMAQELDAAQKALQSAEKDRERLREDRAELERALNHATQPREAASAAPEMPTVPTAAVPQPELLKTPAGLDEIFAGELREMILTSLAEAQASARQAGHDRRAAVLEAFLAANPPSGELDRRRARLRQILKNAGSFNDAHVLAELAELGIRPVSGRKHWKLDYGGLRLTMAKTPSDFRSSRNAATEMGNRCY